MAGVERAQVARVGLDGSVYVVVPRTARSHAVGPVLMPPGIPAAPGDLLLVAALGSSIDDLAILANLTQPGGFTGAARHRAGVTFHPVGQLPLSVPDQEQGAVTWHWDAGREEIVLDAPGVYGCTLAVVFQGAPAGSTITLDLFADTAGSAPGQVSNSYGTPASPPVSAGLSCSLPPWRYAAGDGLGAFMPLFGDPGGLLEVISCELSVSRLG